MKLPICSQTDASFQYQLTYNLYIAAFIGAGVTLLALVSDDHSHGVSLAALPLQAGTTIGSWDLVTLEV